MRKRWWLIVLVVGVLWWLGSQGGPESKPHIALVTCNGMITDAEPWLYRLREIEDDDQVMGMVLRIDSPGGGVAASQEMRDRLASFKKPWVVSMGNMAASGGLMIAAPAPHIFAQPATMTGSIGVIMILSDVSKLMEKIGITSNVITAGTMKDAGSPFRPMNPDERAYLEGVAHTIHEDFIQQVARDRHLDPEALRPLADGRILIGSQAKEAGLVDELGGMLQAKAWLIAQQGWDEGLDLVLHEERKPLLARWMESAAGDLLPESTWIPSGWYAAWPGAVGG
ncbi:MAG: signal peptide peptidase SppA [Alphaproteobacteria bacterium CG_4_10_14_0_2_um_filter_63_37]|nr:MAG: hypothetical protein AUJ55_04380 [Proteobacteria bacterium CG1_02_64_396]PJA23540.1 MAG: signal peptide peptidase SppA [Alphaproteobacteria bacterium CG_4_10_14_0_2_um_filter_63_37]